ncbi:MAG: tetratricopeptide repeat protein, partial [Sphaerospermopsis sp. SIO1G2]|nr:tetratricopeptide repeat protein [Sphaerospermopsis sp. SIO1G2]
MKNISILLLSIFYLITGLAVEQAIGKESHINNLTVSEAISPEERARKLYEGKDFSASVEILKKTITNYQQVGDIPGLIIAWRNLSLVYQKIGDIQQANQAINQSLNQIKQLQNSRNNQTLLAQTLEVKGQLQFSVGDSQAALETWQRTTEIYQNIGDNSGLLRSRINQSLALQALGLYSQAINTLMVSQKSLEQQQDNLVKAQTL